MGRGVFFSCLIGFAHFAEMFYVGDETGQLTESYGAWKLVGANKSISLSLLRFVFLPMVADIRILPSTFNFFR